MIRFGIIAQNGALFIDGWRSEKFSDHQPDEKGSDQARHEPDSDQFLHIISTRAEAKFCFSRSVGEKHSLVGGNSSLNATQSVPDISNVFDSRE